MDNPWSPAKSWLVQYVGTDCGSGATPTIWGLGETGSRSEIGFSLVRCSSHLQQGFDATLSMLVFPLCHGMLQPSATQCHGCHGWISFSQAAPVCSSISHGDQTSQVAVAVGSSFFKSPLHHNGVFLTTWQTYLPNSSSQATELRLASWYSSGPTWADPKNTNSSGMALVSENYGNSTLKIDGLSLCFHQDSHFGVWSPDPSRDCGTCAMVELGLMGYGHPILTRDSL